MRLECDSLYLPHTFDDSSTITSTITIPIPIPIAITINIVS